MTRSSDPSWDHLLGSFWRQASWVWSVSAVPPWRKCWCYGLVCQFPRPEYSQAHLGHHVSIHPPSCCPTGCPGGDWCFHPSLGGDPSEEHLPLHQEHAQVLQGGPTFWLVLRNSCWCWISLKCDFPLLFRVWSKSRPPWITILIYTDQFYLVLNSLYCKSSKDFKLQYFFNWDLGCYSGVPFYFLSS